MHRLASYDTSKPTEVILLFDDSDFEQNLNHSDSDFDENTTNNQFSKDTKTGNAVPNSDSESDKIELKSNSQESNDIYPNTVESNKENHQDKNQSKESKKYNVSHTELKKLLNKTETISEKNLNNLVQNNLTESKKRRHCEPNANIPEKVLKIEPQKLCNNEPPSEIETRGSLFSTYVTQDSFYVSKLLNRVSECLLLIIKAFTLHMLVQNSNKEQNRIDKSMTNFLCLKYQLFKLCFVTVENIMVPNADNEGFIRKFIADTVKLGSEMSIVCTHSQIELILKELMTWIAKKTNALNTLTIEKILEIHKVESSGPTSKNNLLQKNVKKPWKLPSINSKLETSPTCFDITKNTMNTISKSKVNSNIPLSHANCIPLPSTNSTPLVHTNDYSLMHTNYGVVPKNVDLTNSCPESNNISEIHALHSPIATPKHVELETNTNLETANNSATTSVNNCTRKPGNNYTACYVKENNDLTKTNNDMVIKNLETFLNTPLSGRPTNNVIFSSGPPGQQVSIAIDNAVLKQQLQYTNANLFQKSSKLHQQREIPQNWHQLQSPQQQIPLQRLPHQQMPQQQYPQRQTPPQYLPQQYLPHNHTTNQRNQVPHSSDSRRFDVTQSQQHSQNAVPQNKVLPPPYQQHQPQMVPTSTHQYQNIFPSYGTPEQNEQKAQPEIIRSSSSDSGFTSPLNFNSPAPTNTQVILFLMLFFL